MQESETDVRCLEGHKDENNSQKVDERGRERERYGRRKVMKRTKQSKLK